ncbi:MULTISPECIES: DUF4433 domain-containing protein [Staphylococcus]|uniref:DUF4433 domain-containing protein n=1 Tax=Staphylococcus TaxID=1279 RepID=UPI0021D2D329|nr:DUF4433 domain-containing protein [Staphylococcus sp. IVB6181]UXV35107.1 DUF4433 domain-containing protein [Staphylococcus sp. IVB6181]
MFESILKEREITRLCHFTKSKNLPFILGEGIDSDDGILANNFISDTSFLDKTDKDRYDKHEDYICTSVQYPNCYYFSSVLKRSINQIFNEWVILLIDPKVIDQTTKFCSVNAATKGGTLIEKGPEALEKMFDEVVVGKTDFYRPDSYPDNTPTNIQGEVLVYKKVAKEDIIGLVFPTDKIAENECLRLELCGVNIKDYDIVSSSDLFEKKEVVKLLKKGELPYEKVMKISNHG